MSVTSVGVVLRSLVQQEPILFARSILDNIRYGQEDTSGAWGHGAQSVRHEIRCQLFEVATLAC